MSINSFVRTLAAPPPEFAWAWALERPASEQLSVHVVRELATEARTLPNEDELILWFGAPILNTGRIFSIISATTNAGAPPDSTSKLTAGRSPPPTPGYERC